MFLITSNYLRRRQEISPTNPAHLPTTPSSASKATPFVIHLSANHRCHLRGERGHRPCREISKSWYIARQHWFPGREPGSACLQSWRRFTKDTAAPRSFKESATQPPRLCFPWVLWPDWKIPGIVCEKMRIDRMKAGVGEARVGGRENPWRFPRQSEDACKRRRVCRE